jgi:methionyl-tRNA formyltransferase
VSTSASKAETGLRIVGFHVMPMVYRFVAEWVERAGHRLVLVVTSPGRVHESVEERYGSSVADLLAAVPPSQDVLVSRRMKSVITPVVRALAPDLILSATFPHRLPPELVAIPRLGAVNLHPTPLPRGRGGNPLRLLYEGDREASATLHRIVPEWDAGPILSLQSRPIPEGATAAELGATMIEALVAALDEGVARTVAGEPGEPQDERLATEALPFTEAERRLDWREPGRTLQRRALALNFPIGARAVGEISGSCYPVRAVRPLPGASCGAPGTLIERRDDTLIVCAGDGPVAVEVGSGIAPE